MLLHPHCTNSWYTHHRQGQIVIGQSSLCSNPLNKLEFERLCRRDTSSSSKYTCNTQHITTMRILSHSRTTQTTPYWFQDSLLAGFLQLPHCTRWDLRTGYPTIRQTRNKPHLSNKNRPKTQRWKKDTRNNAGIVFMFAAVTFKRGLICVFVALVTWPCCQLLTRAWTNGNSGEKLKCVNSNLTIDCNCFF